MLAITLVASAILKVHGRRVGLWGISFGLLAVGMGIVALSSGNGARALAEGRILWDWGSLPHALARTAWHGGNWVAQGSGLLIALGVNLSAPEPRRSIFPEWVSRKVALGLAAASLALVLGVDAVVMVAAGASPPLRLEAWFYWEFALSLTFLIGVLDAEFDLLPSAMSARATTLRTSALMLLAFHLVTAAGFERAIRDLGGPAQAWSRLASDSLILNEDPRDVRAVLQATPSEYLSPGIGEATPWVDTCWQNFVRGRKTEFEEGH